MELDAFDRRLLDAVQEDNRRTGEELGDLVGLSPAGCLHRLQRLRSNGAIEREVAILDTKLAGPRLTLIVLVTLQCEGFDLNDGFSRAMRRAPCRRRGGVRGLHAAPPVWKRCPLVRDDGGHGTGEVLHCGVVGGRPGSARRCRTVDNLDQPPKRSFSASSPLLKTIPVKVCTQSSILSGSQSNVVHHSTKVRSPSVNGMTRKVAW